MASYTKYEGPGEIYVQGRLLAECTKCSFSVKANNNPVVTMQKQLAGKSDGARSSEGTIESAVPRKGYEVDFVRYCIEGTELTVVVKSGGRRHQFPMWVESVEWSNATDSTTLLSASLSGGPPRTLGG
jgi:hypothetical protein